jgi:hypothetical protein
MGSSFEVTYWNWRDKTYITYWQGESVFGAVLAMIRCRSKGWKCMNLIWRPLG